MEHAARCIRHDKQEKNVEKKEKHKHTPKPVITTKHRGTRNGASVGEYILSMSYFTISVSVQTLLLLFRL